MSNQISEDKEGEEETNWQQTHDYLSARLFAGFQLTPDERKEYEETQKLAKEGKINPVEIEKFD